VTDWRGTASRAKSAVYDCFLIYLSRPRGYTEWWRMTRVPCGCGRTLRGTKVCRYNWHSAGPLSWPLPMLKYKYIFKWNIRKRFYQTALGNCYGLKSPKCWLQVKNNFIVLFIIIFWDTCFIYEDPRVRHGGGGIAKVLCRGATSPVSRPTSTLRYDRWDASYIHCSGAATSRQQ